MAGIAINLYSVRELDEPLERTLDRVGDAGYDGVQFSGEIDPAAADLAAKIEETGLDPVPAHVGIDRLENELAETRSFYETLGIDGVVVPWLGPEEFETNARVGATIDRLASLADRVEDAGFDMYYHNHDQEFQDVDDVTGFDRLVNETDFGIELDVGWAAAGGRDPARLLETLGSRGSVVHFKDVDVESCTPVEIGEGDVDMQACADAARAADADWFIYEHDHPEDPVASIDHGAEFLRGL